MSGLIEGLPDAVAIRCLARVPFYLHPKLELVSRSWQAAIRSPELFKARQEVGSSEELICVCAFMLENLWQMYDPLRDLWITLPVLPSNFTHLSDFGAASTAGKLFVIGGQNGDNGDVTDEVWSYDPVVRKWASRASMLIPRYMFACCVFNGKIVVAGGVTSSGEPISKAEMYDPEKDVWIPMPDLHHTCRSVCSGVIIGGKVHVIHKGLSTVQILDNAGVGWIVEDYGWLIYGPMAVVQDSLYVLNHGHIVKQEKDGRKVSVPLFPVRMWCAMIGLGDELYVIGGFAAPASAGGSSPLSNVDVLTVGNERPTWRKVAPMTECRGIMHGCTLLRI